MKTKNVSISDWWGVGKMSEDWQRVACWFAARRNCVFEIERLAPDASYDFELTASSKDKSFSDSILINEDFLRSFLDDTIGYGVKPILSSRIKGLGKK